MNWEEFRQASAKSVVVAHFYQHIIVARHMQGIDDLEMEIDILPDSAVNNCQNSDTSRRHLLPLFSSQCHIIELYLIVLTISNGALNGDSFARRPRE
jgi:hypothetical protein